MNHTRLRTADYSRFVKLSDKGPAHIIIFSFPIGRFRKAFRASEVEYIVYVDTFTLLFPFDVVN